jgi:hypothetical protein
MNRPRFPAAAPFIALATILLSLSAWWLLPPEVILQWLDEGAAVEDFTIVLYLLAMAWLLFGSRSMPTGVALALALTMAAFAAREADWHIHFTGTSMLRVSYYLGPAPVLHKAASLGVLAVLLSAWTYLLAATMRAWRAGRLGSGALRTNVATFGVVLAATKLLDRSLSVAQEDFGMAAGPAARALQLALEEPLEMALPLIVLATAWQYRSGTMSLVARRAAAGDTAAAEAMPSTR